MNKFKKYIICENEIGLVEYDSWAIVEAKSKEEAFNLFIKNKGIYNKSFLCSLDMLLVDSFMLNRGEITENYKKELFNYLEGNKEWYNCILAICSDKEKRIYVEKTEELELGIPQDLLMFIYKKEKSEAMLVLDIDEKYLKI